MPSVLTPPRAELAGTAVLMACSCGTAAGSAKLPLIKLTGDWMVGGVNVRFFPEYMARISGSGLILYGFVVAYAIARVRSRRADDAPAPVEKAESALVGV